MPVLNNAHRFTPSAILPSAMVCSSAVIIAIRALRKVRCFLADAVANWWLAHSPSVVGMTSAPASESPAHDAARKMVSVSQFVPATPQQIFELLATPKRHCEIDGSGTLRGELSGPTRLSLGAKFGMSMRLYVPYRITNTVVEFEEGKQIGWRHFGGHIWRYILAPVEGGTMVTEQFDYKTNKANWFLRSMNAIVNNEVAMRKTLLNLAKQFS
jgi:hypothetical protein